jgi:formate hydrogenlyase transcriptional activator
VGTLVHSIPGNRDTKAHWFDQIIGTSGALETVLEKVELVAPTDSTVLVQGETGTGKELIARAIHSLSQRCGRSFIAVNCAAIPFDLLESELFGHEKGAFTGAIAQKVGRFEMANRGTLFLDEIGDIPLALQPKLLRVLQEQKFERLGSGQTHQVDVRLVAATHRNLEEMIKHNQFRSDLYYRLNVFPITLPPLRERSDDIVPLVMHYVEVFARRMRKTIEHVPDKTLAAFKYYSWPGNVRELQNVVERAVILSKDGSLPNPLTSTTSDVPSENLGLTTLRASQRSLILQTLEAVNWVIGGAEGAAAKLGVPRTTLVSKMRKLGISRRVRCFN